MKPKIRAIPISSRPKPLPELETFQQEDSEDLSAPSEAYYDRAAEIEKKNGITGWRLFALGLLGTNLLFGLITMGMLGTANSRAFPTVIARSNGEMESIEFFTGNTRSPALIKLFAEKFVSELYTWRSYLPEKGSPPDPGMQLEGGGKIPTTVFRYTLGMEPEFAKSYRKQLSELKEITQGGSSNQVETMYVPQQLSEPEAIGSDRWKIKVTGVQLIANSKNTPPATVRVDLELTLRAVPPPILSEVAQQYTDPGIAKAVMTARAMGLEVTNITNLTPTKK
ncbi:hypothetical protein [Chamaesiphon sp.]|uniref:hypothetical protein n=1 Tax=Chamaesiphon sp. TaxID=2814140 RepID=UPI00359421DE